MTGHPDKGQWYVRKNGRIRGPLPGGQITREILLGRIRDSDELGVDTEHWLPLRALPQLVPEVMRHANSEEGRQHLLLARLREDERQRGRRIPGHAADGVTLRHGDRRTVESFDVELPHAPTAVESRDERNLLLPAAVIMIALFTLVTAYLWYRPAKQLAGSDCQAVPAAAVNWSGCVMPGRNIGSVDLSRADLSHSILKSANLRGALLRSANLSYANLEDADLRDADLSQTNFKATLLRGAKFSRAIWIDGRECADGSVGECR